MPVYCVREREHALIGLWRLRWCSDDAVRGERERRRRVSCGLGGRSSPVGSCRVTCRFARKTYWTPSVGGPSSPVTVEESTSAFGWVSSFHAVRTHL